MAVMTLSRQLGCHGEDISIQVARELGLRLIDAETISQAAQRAGVPQPALAEMEHEGERGLAGQVLNALRTMPSLSAGLESRATEAPSLAMPFAGLFSPTAPPISASVEGYVRMVGLVVRGLAREGNVLIVGRGGQVLLHKHPHAFHVQIVAPFACRTKVLMRRQGIDRRAAEHRLRASDRARADYLRRYHGVDWLDPTLYHLIVNTGCVPVPAAVDLIVSAYRATAQEGSSSHAPA